MLHEVLSFPKDSRALEYEIDAHPSPRQTRWILLAKDRIILTIDPQRTLVCPNIPVPPSVHGVEFQQISQIVSGQHIVDSRKMQRWLIQKDFEGSPTDPAQS